MKARDLKVGDIYKPIEGPGHFRGVRHLVTEIKSKTVKYKTLDNVYNEYNRQLVYLAGLEAEDFYSDLDNWKFISINNRKNHLPEWL